MGKTRPFDGMIRRIYLALTVVICLIAFACIFDTFNLSFSAAFYNLLLLLPLLGLSLVITRRFDLAVILASAVAFTVYYVDTLVYSLRLTHIRLSDFIQIGQAARVANRYHLIWTYELTRRLALVIAICAFVLFIRFYYRLQYPKDGVFLTGLGFLAIGMIVFFTGVLPHNPETFNFTAEAEHNGLLYSWYCQYHESKLVESEGYSKAKAESILAAYQPIDGASDINVIVIMNESLSDYSLFGETPFDDPLPNIHSYKDNFFYGKLAVSVFGGGTCNTEYEFLTGNALAFLPEGATPYLLMDFVITRSTFPSSQALIISLKPPRLLVPVPEIPSSAKMSTISQPGLLLMRLVKYST